MYFAEQKFKSIIASLLSKSAWLYNTIIVAEFTYKFVENEGELEGAFEVRRQVFAIEQGIAEDLDFDGYDNEARHLVVKKEGRIIGTARVRFLEAGQAKLERMAILLPYRRQGIGKRIISFLAKDLREKQVKTLVLHAQYEIIDFYKSCGFEIAGSPFWEAGIKHIEMIREF